MASSSSRISVAIVLATGLTDSDQRGWIEFANGRAELSCAPDGLHLAIQANPDDLARLEDVVGRHLLRFGTARPAPRPLVAQ
jgi:hypothetical protein